MYGIILQDAFFERSLYSICNIFLAGAQKMIIGTKIIKKRCRPVVLHQRIAITSIKNI
jgi:hypothetical protein